MGLTPASVNAWPLAWVALAPLWIALQHRTALRQAQDPSKIQTYLFGASLWAIGFHGTALSWITGLHPLTWLGIPWLGSIAITAFAWLFITLWSIGFLVAWAFGFIALSRWCRLDLIGRVLVGTALWSGLEVLWSWTPLDWTTLAFTQSPHNLPILHLGQVSGSFTVSAVIVAVNGLLAESIIHRPPNMLISRKIALSAVLLLLLAHGVGYGLLQQPLGDSPSQGLKIGILQGNIPTRVKLTGQGIKQARELYAEGYRQLASAGADAILTPEGALPDYWDDFTQENHFFNRLVQQNQAVLWLGTFVIAQSSDFHITQSLLTLTPKSSSGDPSMADHRRLDAIKRYDKIKLVPLGEYIPFQSVLGEVIARLSPISTGMIPGQRTQVFDAGVGIAAVGICYDSAFGWIFRDQVARGGEFILTASNNDPYPVRMMAQHHAQDVIRAIETDRWTVRGTNTGLSGIVNPHGQATWLASPNQYVSHIGQIYRRQGKTLYVRWGNWLTPFLLGCSLLWIGGCQFLRGNRQQY